MLNKIKIETFLAILITFSGTNIDRFTGFTFLICVMINRLNLTLFASLRTAHAMFPGNIIIYDYANLEIAGN